jgi:hypothetical protein
MPGTVTSVGTEVGFDLEIRIQFERGSADPSRIFQSMARTIDAIGSLEASLAGAVATNLQPVLVLQDVRAQSLVAIVRTIIDFVDGESSVDPGWLGPAGRYLERAVTVVLRFLADRETVESVEEAVALQDELADIAQEEGAVIPLQSARVPLPNLLSSLRDIGTANRELHPQDEIVVSAGEARIPLNKQFHLPAERVEQLLTTETLLHEGVHRLDVKKPDYLGSSMWQFRLDDRVIDAKILDTFWVHKFQHGRIELRPGDALLAEMLFEARMGANGEHLSTHYYVARILDILHDSPDDQTRLPFTGSDDA